MNIQIIKHQFLAFRNGIISDTLRKAGSPFEIIFGLQLPQLKDIAKEIGKDRALGLELWADSKVREARILALLILPPDSISLDDALRMASDIRSREEADLLPFLLLRHTPHIPALLSSISKVPSPDPLQEYLFTTLSRFL